MARAASAFRRRWLALLVLGLCLSAVAAPQEYRYLECERYAAESGSGLRNEGFTPWLAHPSHGAVMILGGPGHWLEYELTDLGPGPYHVFVRGLAWAKGCDIDVFWDGQKVGTTSYARPATALRWSQAVGTVSGPGTRRLRLVGAAGNTQAPYLDAVLLTTQDGLQPPDGDRDFQSFTTALPPLSLGAGANAPTILPDAAAGQVVPDAGVAIRRVAVDGLLVGSAEAVLALVSDQPMTVRAEFGVEGAPATAVEAVLPGGAGEQLLRVRCPVRRAGPTHLRLALTCAGRTLIGGQYGVVVPAPVAVALDESAWPLGSPSVTWQAAVRTAPETAAALRATLELTAVGAAAVLARHEVAGAAAGLRQPIALAACGPGWYEIRSRFMLAGEIVCEDLRRFVIYSPVPLEQWVPVKTSRADGARLLLNERPFLGRLLFHAAPNAATRSHGFNLVQCFGGDPDPLESIQRHLDLCAQHGLWGMVALFNNRFFLPGPQFDREHLRAAVTRFRDHPALFGWDLIDEPDGHPGMTPAEVAALARLVRDLDPNHVVWVNLCRLDRALDWLDSQDLWSYDAYPFPTQGFAGYAPWLKISDAALAGRKPLGTCLQTYQWSDLATLPMPTPDQLRASAWLHILHGYTFFGYYSYHDPEPAGCLARAPELWSYCRALNAELQAMSGLILDPAPFQALEVLDGAGEVAAGLKEWDGGRHLVVVSGARAPVRCRVRVPAAVAAVEVRGDRPRRLVAHAGLVDIELSAYGTLVGVASASAPAGP